MENLRESENNFQILKYVTIQSALVQFKETNIYKKLHIFEITTLKCVFLS